MRPESRRVSLHPLVICRDGDEWLVGRPETDTFVSVPVHGVTFIRSLQAGDTVTTATTKVLLDHGQDVDGPGFVETLVELGFAAGDGGRRLDVVQPQAPSLPWLKPGSARRLFSAPVYTLAALLLVAGGAAGTVNGTLVPSYRDFFISNWQGINLATNTALFVAGTALHEFMHLAAARAEGVHARIGLSTRLHLLTAQTTVTGLWAAPRRVRFRVYSAGLLADLLVIAVSQLAIVTGWVSGVAAACLQALCLGQAMAVATQFALYTRTDIYLVLQEALRCRNLYADAVDYVRYIGSRLIGQVAPDPTTALPSRERFPIKAYAVVMGLGSAASLAAFACYGAPLTVGIFARAIREAAQGWRSADLPRLADGLLVIAVHGTLQGTFLKLFVGKHGSRMVRLLSRWRPISRLTPAKNATRTRR